MLTWQLSVDLFNVYFDSWYYEYNCDIRTVSLELNSTRKNIK